MEGKCGHRLCRAHGAETHLWKVGRNSGKLSHLRKVGRVQPEDSGVRWLDGLRSRKVGGVRWIGMCGRGWLDG